MEIELTHRLRRLRRTPAIRALTTECALTPDKLIQPVFVHDAPTDRVIDSMPGISRQSLPSLLRTCEEVLQLGLAGIALFPVIDPAHKDPTGSHATDESGLLYRTLRQIKESFPDLLVIADVALDPFTDHGHDGLLTADGSDIANDETVEVLCRLAVAEARHGADIVAPSDMMDGRIGAIRAALDAEGFHQTPILSYAAKYASAYYGPFRDAVGSRTGGLLSKATYQLSPANSREALNEVVLDEAEGADLLMVKPAGPYLDVITRVRDITLRPVAAYQVSGEYAQIVAAANNGWLDLAATRDESLLAIRRAGADIILSYFSIDHARDHRRTL